VTPISLLFVPKATFFQSKQSTICLHLFHLPFTAQGDESHCNVFSNYFWKAWGGGSPLLASSLPPSSRSLLVVSTSASSASVSIPVVPTRGHCLSCQLLPVFAPGGSRTHQSCHSATLLWPLLLPLFLMHPALIPEVTLWYSQLLWWVKTFSAPFEPSGKPGPMLICVADTYECEVCVSSS
jgi:hypothetical protein